MLDTGLLSLSLYTFVNQSLLLQLLSFVQVTSNGFQPFIKMLKDTFPAWISNNNHHKHNNNAFYSSFLNPLWLQKWGEDEKKESTNVQYPRTHLVSGQYLKPTSRTLQSCFWRNNSQKVWFSFIQPFARLIAHTHLNALKKTKKKH